MRIIPFESKYRDDMIFMVLAAKDALGRAPSLNEDLLDVPGNYLLNGDMFYLAIDENDRVVGCGGYRSIENTSEVWLHRLYVKPGFKRMGIGSQVLRAVEEYAKSMGKTVMHVHLGEPESVWFESYRFYPSHGFSVYSDDAPRYMKKKL